MVTQTVTTDSNGNFSFQFMEEDIGSNTITISFAGNSRYNSSNASKSYVVGKASTYLEITNTIGDFEAGKPIMLVGRLVRTSDNTQINLSSSNPVTVSVNDTPLTPTYTNGLFNAEFTPHISGLYTYSISYAGNTLYKNTVLVEDYDVYKQDPILTLSNANITRKIGETSTVTGNFVDENNNAITGAILSLNSGSTPTGVTATTSLSGFSITIASSSSTATQDFFVHFAGDDTFNTVQQALRVVTVKRNSILTINDIPDTTYHNTITISGTLLDEDGTTPISNASLVIDY